MKAILKKNFGCLYGLSLFSLALLGTTIFAVVAWKILSMTLHIQTTNEVRTMLGILNSPLSDIEQLVKPEPVENYTFLLSAVAGILFFGTAGYFSACYQPKSWSLSIRCITLLCLVLGAFELGIWLIAMRWDSIIPPNQSQLFEVVRSHPSFFIALTISMSILLWIVGKLEMKARWRFFPLITCVVPLAVLSCMVLTNNDDTYITTSHYEVFIWPIIQDWLNRGIHLAQKSQYGMYPIFLRPIWSLFGAPTTRALAFVMSGMLLLSNIAMLVFMVRFSRHKTMATIFALLAVLFTLLFYPFWPQDAFFQFFPIRLIFPALSMAFICMPFIRLRYPWVVYVVLAFGLAWNFESGLVGLILFSVFSIALRFVPKWYDFIILLLKQIGMAIAAIALAAFCVTTYYLYRFGSIPQFSGILTMIKAFSAGVGAEPMPIFGAWIFHVIIYGAAIYTGISWLFLSSKDASASRERAAALLALAAMGLLWLRYYQGRSLPLPLTFATMPAIFCVGMLLDSVFSALPRYGRIVSVIVAIMIGAPLLSALLLWAGTDPVPQRQLTKLMQETTNARMNMIVDQVIEDFDLRRNQAEDQLLVVAPYSHLVQLKLKQPSRINVAGMCQFWFESEIDDLVLALKDPKTTEFVFDRNDACPISGVLCHPRVKVLLSSEFKMLPKGKGCSLVDVENKKVFVRKGFKQNMEELHLVNVAFGRSASESSSFANSKASAAVDGSSNGEFDRRSTTHTALEENPWWQVDLGRSVSIDAVQIWNRIDCCSERLRDYWVFVSDKPFEKEQNLDELKNRPDVAKNFQVAIPCPNSTIRLKAVHGRYVRIQLQGTGYLSLAEVKVFPSITN